MNLLELIRSVEGPELEFKGAQGGLPGELWPTYSAFANTAGGTVVLGVKEVDSRFTVVGVPNLARVRKNLFDCLNDRQKTSANVLGSGDVQVVEVDGKHLLVSSIPEAPRGQKPIYINGNMMTGTYHRLDEADYRCSDETVRRMVAESLGARDDQLLSTHGFDDLDRLSLTAYRNLFRSANPDHVWLALDDQAFLTQLGGWRKDRESASQGPTLAGILMFGQQLPILEVLNTYQVDYREADDEDPDVRWSYRHTVDGRWSPNLFEFYVRTVARLTRDISIPFRLENLQRIDDTHVGEALREALVNSIVHADYAAGGGVAVVRSRQVFRFENPGDLRVSVEQAFSGGVSDCRNPALQRMFRMVGFGEQAGSGVPRIVRAWREQAWRAPDLWEDKERYRTSLLLLTASMLPEASLGRLRALYGPERFAAFSQDEVMAVVTADVEGQVSKGRLSHLAGRHPVDAANILKDMAERKLLEVSGPGRRVYTLPKIAAQSTQLSLLDSTHSSPNSTLSGGSSQHSVPTAEEKLAREWEQLVKLAEPVSRQGWQRRQIVRHTIVELCRVRPLRLADLSLLLNRVPQALRQSYLNPLIDEGRLKYLYPGEPTHPSQAYESADGPDQP